MSKKKSKSFIGIDVSKQLLEVAAHESDYQFRCPNKASAFGELIAELIALRPALIVLEATGGLEIPVVSALHACRLAGGGGQPTASARFRQSPGPIG